MFHCTYTTSSLSIHSSVDGHLGCFHVLAVLSNAALTIEVPVSFWINIFIFFPDIYPEVELMSHMVVLFLVFLRNSHTVFHSGYTNLHSQQQCIRVHLYRHTHQDLLFPTFLMITILMGVRWYLIVVLNFPDDKWYWASFPVLVGHLYVFFIKCLFRSGLLPIFKMEFFNGCLKTKTA